MGQAIAESFRIPFADLTSRQPSREQVTKIPEALAKKHRIVLFEQTPEKIVLATDIPVQQYPKAELSQIFPNIPISIAYASADEIEGTFIHYRKPLETRFTKIIKEQKRVAPEIFEEIISDAAAYKSSDVHFEPQEKQVVVRFRIDGVLREVARLDKTQYENIINRIKVLAHLRIDEHYAAQDGAIRFAKEGKSTDLRVSIAPTLDGEKVAIRILGQYIKSFTLSDLGLSTHDQEILSQSAKKPYGMILVTGPTGSGKTTTLYALLKILNSPDLNVTTIEDPVEYKITGINQIQVNLQTGLTFAKGLRTIVRQDPNIILVGEIRDTETAEIAVNAALTGHLLLSTFHANDAATAIPRLLDMGVEPFLLASTLELVIAQRLVRKICENCRQSESVNVHDSLNISPAAKSYFPAGPINLYHGKGCKSCSDTGFSGRTAIYEIIQITKELEELALKHPSSEQIWEVARKQGAQTLFKDGVEKVKNGVTTLEELIRVASPNELNGENGVPKTLSKAS